MTIVAIDGPTGVGKSTTARAVACELDAVLVLDPVSVSPFLDDYYTGEANPAAALGAELAFLRSRADLLASAPTDTLTVADFSVMRTAPFAEFLDEPSDRARVLTEMHALIADGPSIDVLVLLDAEPDALLARVHARARNAETELTIEHLVALREHFTAWHRQLCDQASTTIEIDTATWDPRRSDHLDDLIGRIRSAIGS